ncbi:MAG: hypothetical protein LBS62_06230 [Clostridiales bacterium]|jgi:hypothetical protein|nr:hypothetical protein [Clostridiales bacterium]
MDNDSNQNQSTKGMSAGKPGLGVALGICVGTALGAVFGSIAIGIALGVSFGAAGSLLISKKPSGKL